MLRSWMLAAPAALALLVAGCTTSGPSNQISPVANSGSGVGNAPGNPVSPNTPPAISGSLTNTEAQSPAPATTSTPRSRRATRPGSQSNAAGFGGGRAGGQTTSGPSAVGRAPASSQPVGNSGS